MKLKIKIDDKLYEVDVEVAEDEPGVPHAYVPPSGAVRVPAAPLMAAPPAIQQKNGPPVDEDKVCRSPIAGIVVRINAHPGQKIQAGDSLLVLEAMKMETNITAPVAGSVKTVNVNVGDGVQGGQVLVEFE